MRSPFVPVALFVALIVSVLIALPLAGTAFVSLSFFGFMVSLACLGWWVVRADRRVGAAPAAEAEELPMLLAEDDLPPLEPDWDSFERDFWIHVAEQETAWGSD
jgi:hypothetical protein